MRAAVIALMTIIALMTSVIAPAIAQSRKVLVLPLDGSTPGETRSKLNGSVAKLAKDKLGGDVTVGDTTFNETAAAVGCNPDDAACAEQVRTTLAVDELVWGSANSDNGNVTVTVNRQSAGATAPRTQVTVIRETAAPESAEPQLAGAFGDTSSASSGSSGPGFFSTRERKLGVGFAAGSVLALVIGFSMWSSASNLQVDIDAHPKSTLAQIDDLKALEDRAGSKALWGNVLVITGLALGGVGGYFLWKDRKNRKAARLAPAPTETGTGMTLVLGGQW